MHNLQSQLRTLLVLGRVSNLPTVWSNCFVAWMLGGGGEPLTLLQLVLGASLLYVGGMYWNDACDADFDRACRPERPIPKNAIEETTVWVLGAVWMGAGWLALALLGRGPAIWASALVVCIVVYDTTHKLLPGAPIWMAACRLGLYLVGASAGAEGVTGLAVWNGISLAVYVLGISVLARREALAERTVGPPPLALLLLAIPLFMAWILNGSAMGQAPTVLLAAVFLVWLLRAVWCLWSFSPPRIGDAVGGLLAGIVWVDLLADPGASMEQMGLLVAGFLAARLAQKWIPAT